MGPPGQSRALASAPRAPGTPCCADRAFCRSLTFCPFTRDLRKSRRRPRPAGLEKGRNRPTGRTLVAGHCWVQSNYGLVVAGEQHPISVSDPGLLGEDQK